MEDPLEWPVADGLFLFPTSPLICSPEEVREGDHTKTDYRRLKAGLQAELDSLKEPDAPQVEAAGETLEGLAEAWEGAPVRLRREMLLTIFQEVRADVAARHVHCVKPWPPFLPLFRMDGLQEKHGCFYVEKET